MSDSIEPHEARPDCDCHSCALAERNRLRASLAAIYCRLTYGQEVTEAAVRSLVKECEFAMPKLVDLKAQTHISDKTKFTVSES